MKTRLQLVSTSLQQSSYQNAELSSISFNICRVIPNTSVDISSLEYISLPEFSVDKFFACG